MLCREKCPPAPNVTSSNVADPEVHDEDRLGLSGSLESTSDMMQPPSRASAREGPHDPTGAD